MSIGNDEPSSTLLVSDDPSVTHAGTQSSPAPASEASPPRKPVSPRKLAANRANAARSTGPRTSSGKSRVAMNAVKHGLASQSALLPGENPAELEALAGAYEQDLKPRGALEADLVARIVSIAWRLRRVARAEESMWQAEDQDLVNWAEARVRTRAIFARSSPAREDDDDDVFPPPPMPAGKFVARQFSHDGNSPLERLAVYEQRLGRSLHAAIRELNMLRKLRREYESDEQDLPALVPVADETNAQDKPAAVLERSSKALEQAPDGTVGHIEQNKPTARPGRVSDPGVETQDDVGAGGQRSPFDAGHEPQHPPSP